MQTSEQISELAKALAKAQGEINNAIKNSANPHFKSRYADLAAIWDVIREPISKHGLSVLQTINVEMTDKTSAIVTVNTLLLHESGQWIRDSLPLPITKVDPQAIGSASTYGRRYSLQAIAGVAGEDDDGNAASGKGAAPPVLTLSAKQIGELSSYLAKLGKDEAAFANHMGVATLADIPAISFNNAMAILKRVEEKAQNAALKAAQEKVDAQSHSPAGE